MHLFERFGLSIKDAFGTKNNGNILNIPFKIQIKSINGWNCLEIKEKIVSNFFAEFFQEYVKYKVSPFKKFDKFIGFRQHIHCLHEK